MKHFLLSLITCILTFQHIHSQSVAVTRCNRFKQGVNLSNWLEAYWQTGWPTPGNYGRQFLADMKNAGFKSVRLPVCFAQVTDTLAPYNVDTANAVFAYVDSVIKWTAELDMNLIIDNHHQWTFDDTSWRRTIPRLGHLWSVLGKRYNYLNPEKYFFEILNEPYNIHNDSMRQLFIGVLDSLRPQVPNHSIVVSSGAWSGGIGYIAYQPLPDTNLIYTFHSYDPVQFTHQGFPWFSPYEPAGTPYPGSGFDFLLPLAWEASVAFRDSFHVPMFLGEFGVGTHADPVSRCNWIDTVGARIDYYNMPAFSWDVKWDFYLYNSGVTTRDSVVPCFMQALHLYEDSTTAVNNITETLNTDLYPNPATGSFVCRIANAGQTSIDVYNHTGQLVHHQTFIAGTEINTSQWARGLYLVKLQSNGRVAVKRLVVE
jgi:endoglucanase